MSLNRDERISVAYRLYLAVRKEITEYDIKNNMSYFARVLGQLIYHKFGKKIIGISESAKVSDANMITEDHYNNCQKVGEFLATSNTLSIEEFKVVIEESSKTIKVTKTENSSLRKYQKNRPYGEGISAYSDAGINVEFY